MPAPTPDHIRAQIIADLQRGDSLQEVATRYNVDKATVSRFKNTVGPVLLQEVARQRVETIGELVENHLRAGLKVTTTIANQLNDPEWLRQQTPKDLAVLYGVVTDKAIRILEASERARERDAAAQLLHGSAAAVSAWD